MENISILIVENLRLIAMDIRNVCRKLGYSCRSINYNSDTLRKIKAINPDLILMDMKLDDNQNIIDVAEKICDEFTVPIIFFTTEAVDSYESARLNKRCLFHPIPFMWEELVQDIKKLLLDHKTAYM